MPPALRPHKPLRQAAHADAPHVLVLEPPPASNCDMVAVSVLLTHNKANIKMNVIHSNCYMVAVSVMSCHHSIRGKTEHGPGCSSAGTA